MGLELWPLAAGESPDLSPFHLDENACDCDCQSGSVCTLAEACVLWDQCGDGCGGHVCGEVCGVTCGACDPEQMCFRGQCVAAIATSCVDCPLILSVVANTGINGTIDVVLDFAPQPNDVLPRLADLGFRTVALDLQSVVVGAALQDAGKTLLTDAAGRPWMVVDGGVRVVVAATNSSTIGVGTLMTLHFQRRGRPAAVQLERHYQVFAPAAADEAIQASLYDAPVVVVP